jgi:hypothetical protein
LMLGENLYLMLIGITIGTAQSNSLVNITADE